MSTPDKIFILAMVYSLGVTIVGVSGMAVFINEDKWFQRSAALVLLGASVFLLVGIAYSFLVVWA